MTCPHCESWTVTSRSQLKVRQRNIGLGGEIYACPKCGTRDWATSTERIVKPAQIETRKDKMIGGLLFVGFIVFCILMFWFFSKGVAHG